MKCVHLISLHCVLCVSPFAVQTNFALQLNEKLAKEEQERQRAEDELEELQEKLHALEQQSNAAATSVLYIRSEI